MTRNEAVSAKAVPEVGQPDAAVAEDLGDLRDVQPRREGQVGPVAHEQQDDEAAHRREPRDGQNVGAPLQAPHRVDQVRRGLAERERADEDAERHAALAPEPARHDLHARRIDAREEEPRAEAQDDRGPGAAGLERDPRVGGRRQPRAAGDEGARGDDVGQVGDGAQQRPDDEPELHGERQPRGRRARERPLGLQRRRDRRGREPEGHDEQLGERQPDQRAPSFRILGARRDCTHRREA
jgi:hypothetical protein